MSDSRPPSKGALPPPSTPLPLEDPTVVDWDGPDDPMQPMNWPRKKKIACTTTIALITILTPLGSSMIAPTKKLATFVVSVYLLGYAFGPLLLAPLSELYGRVIIYNVCNVLYLVFTIACAVAPNLSALIVFRLLAGTAGSAPLTIGAGSLADMIPAENRGLAMSAWVLGPVLRPVIGPVAGGYIAQAKVFIAVIYGYLYLLFTTITAVFEQTYGFSPGSVGLAYLGVGSGLVFQGLCSDRLFHALTVKHGPAKPEYRLLPLLATCWVIPISLFWYGWTAERKVHWMAPIVGTILLGFGMLNAFTTVSTYLVDAYTVYAASAVAATTVLRSLGGAFLPLAGSPMYASLGLAWGNSLLAFIALAMCPLPFMFYRYGERIRSATSVRL